MLNVENDVKFMFAAFFNGPKKQENQNFVKVFNVMCYNVNKNFH